MFSLFYSVFDFFYYICAELLNFSIMQLVFKFHACGNDGQSVSGSLIRNTYSGDLVERVIASNGGYVSRPVTFVIKSVDDCINGLLASGYSTITIYSK